MNFEKSQLVFLIVKFIHVSVRSVQVITCGKLAACLLLSCVYVCLCIRMCVCKGVYVVYHTFNGNVILLSKHSLFIQCFT